MLIPSHTVLASRISDYAKEKYGFHFVLNAIYRGSIMPDLRDKEHGSHYEEACLESASVLWEEILDLEVMISVLLAIRSVKCSTLLRIILQMPTIKSIWRKYAPPYALRNASSFSFDEV